MAQKLIQQALTTRKYDLKYDFQPINITLERARTTLCSGSHGVWVPGALQYLQALTFTCSTCNAWRNWSYSPKLGDKYITLNNIVGPFREISIDPLGPIIIKPGKQEDSESIHTTDEVYKQ